MLRCASFFICALGATIQKGKKVPFPDFVQYVQLRFVKYVSKSYLIMRKISKHCMQICSTSISILAAVEHVSES